MGTEEHEATLPPGIDGADLERRIANQLMGIEKTLGEAEAGSASLDEVVQQLLTGPDKDRAFARLYDISQEPVFEDLLNGGLVSPDPESNNLFDVVAPYVSQLAPADDPFHPATLDQDEGDESVWIFPSEDLGDDRLNQLMMSLVDRLESAGVSVVGEVDQDPVTSQFGIHLTPST